MSKNDFMEEEIKDQNGIIMKSAKLETQEVSEEDLKKINKYTLEPLTKDDVFTFKVVAGDNELDDRNYEPFNLNALKDLKKLYVGKTVIKDHRRTADNQVARIYDTELVTQAKLTKANEPFTELVCKCYMVKTTKNEDLIKEIKAGIKKEVSTGARAKKAICSICGTDNTKTYCPHWGGREYDKEGGKVTCYFTLDGAKEAYELSLVAVPAQKRAGTRKNYGASENYKDDYHENKEVEKLNKQKELDNLNNRIRLCNSFIFARKQSKEE